VTFSEDDEYLAIGKQFGQFFRRADRLYQGIHVDAGGRSLERAAYLLLGRIAGGGPARLSAFASDLGVDLSTVSRQVAALEAAGWVRRSPDATDRRASVIEATEAGQEVFARSRQRWHEALRTLLGDWTSAERREFARLFARLNEGIAAQTARPTVGPRPAAGGGSVADSTGSGQTSGVPGSAEMRPPPRSPRGTRQEHT
jgi:DNA-binding MarR family transcriptional regulator